MSDFNYHEMFPLDEDTTDYLPLTTEHVGLVSAAERACAAVALTDVQRDSVERTLNRARQAFRENGRIHPRQLAGSAGCGTSGCHSDILAEWLPSAHRYASMDFVFQEVQALIGHILAQQHRTVESANNEPIFLFGNSRAVSMHDKVARRFHHGKIQIGGNG